MRFVRRPQRRPIDSDGHAVVFQAIEHGVDQGFALEQLIPFLVGKVGGNQRGFATVALFEELEEGIDLLRLQGQIPQLIDDQHIIGTQAFE